MFVSCFGFLSNVFTQQTNLKYFSSILYDKNNSYGSCFYNQKKTLFILRLCHLVQSASVCTIFQLATGET